MSSDACGNLEQLTISLNGSMQLLSAGVPTASVNRLTKSTSTERRVKTRSVAVLFFKSRRDFDDVVNG